MISSLFIFLSLLACTTSDHEEQHTVQEKVEKTTNVPQKKNKEDLHLKKESIVSLGGNITETIFALGDGTQIVATDASSLYPKEVHQLPKVGYYRQISTEGVLSVKPSLIIASDATGPKESLEQIKKIGVPVHLLSSKKTLEATEERITQIATLLHKEEKGKELVQQIYDDLKNVVKPKTAPKVLFVYARGGGSLNVAGKDTAAANMIALAGGVNAVQEYEGYKPINAESIIKAAPDFILFTTRGLASIGTIDDVLKQKGILQTPAGKNSNIISMDDLLLLGFGPRTGKAAVELSKLIQK